MKTTFLFFNLLLISVASLAQYPGKSFFSPAFGMDFPKNNQAINFSFSAAGRLGKGPLYAGLGVQPTKFDNNKNWYTPVYLNLVVIPPTKGVVFPMVVLRPGYGLYNKTNTIAGTSIVTNGSFTAFWGAGAGFSSKKPVYFLAGCNSYGFKSAGVKSSVTSFSLRAGILL